MNQRPPIQRQSFTQSSHSKTTYKTGLSVFFSLFSAVPIMIAGTSLSVLAAGPGPLQAQAQPQKQNQTQAPPQASGYYTVDFPANARVAELQISIPREFSGKPTQHVTARGRVTLPRQCHINVHLCYDGLEHMDSIEKLDPNTVRRFSAAKLEFDDSHLAHIKNFKNLVALNLDDALVTDKSLPVIGSMTNLVMLRFNGTGITGSGFSNLTNLPNVINLNMAGIQLKPGSISQICNTFPHLGDLVLSKVGLTPVDLPSIAKFKTLTTLAIDGNKAIDNNSIKLLLPLKNLQVLNIADTSVTAKSLPDLYKLPALRVIKIRGHEFWRDSLKQKPKAGITLEDQETSTRLPLDTFSPLH